MLFTVTSFKQGQTLGFSSVLFSKKHFMEFPKYLKTWTLKVSRYFMTCYWVVLKRLYDKVFFSSAPRFWNVYQKLPIRLRQVSTLWQYFQMPNVFINCYSRGYSVVNCKVSYSRQIFLYFQFIYLFIFWLFLCYSCFFSSLQNGKKGFLVRQQPNSITCTKLAKEAIEGGVKHVANKDARTTLFAVVLVSS